jgi:hypothetical protein
LNSVKGKFKFFISSLYKTVTGNLLTDDLFDFCRTFWFSSEKFYIPELCIDGELKTAFKQLSLIAYSFNESYGELIKAERAKLSLTGNFVSIHLRGGDKITERALYKPEDYIKVLKIHSEIKDVFILSDDFSLYAQLVENYPELNFWTLTRPEENGYNHNLFLKRDWPQVQLELVKVFSSIHVMLESDLFIGTYSSNPGMFLGANLSNDKMVGLDSGNWIIM